MITLVVGGQVAGVFYLLFGWQLSPIALAVSSAFVVTNSLRLWGTRLEAANITRAAPPQLV